SGQRERAVEMVRNMERSRRFSSPRVSGENAESGNGPGGTENAADAGKTNFDLLAEYNPPTLEERAAEIAAQKNKGKAAGASTAATAPAMAGRGAPAQAVRPPAYVAPNPQPQRPQPGMRPMPGPNGIPQYTSPMRGPNRGRFNPSGEPSGIDPSGLKNHDRNRLPNPNAQPQTPSQENPQ
ncbi:MAG TPA: hypothetical protein VIM62_08895, partial [Acidobacteriaceae bacterium]